MTSLTAQLEEVKVHVGDEAAQVEVLREELRQREARSHQLEQTQKSLEEQLQAKEKEAATHKLIGT